MQPVNAHKAEQNWTRVVINHMGLLGVRSGFAWPTLSIPLPDQILRACVKSFEPENGDGKCWRCFCFHSQLTARLTFRIAQGEEIFAQLDAHTYEYATGKLIGRLIITPYYL